MSENKNNEEKDFEGRIPTTYTRINKSEETVFPQEKTELPTPPSQILIKE